MYIIAKDAAGDFPSIQAAVDAIPRDNREPITLFVRAGEYREKVIVDRDNLRIVGDAQGGTVIVNNGCAKDKDADGNERAPSCPTPCW